LLVAIGPALGRRWFAVMGFIAAGLIALGVFVPLGLPGADMANFVGYELWSVWLVILAVKILRHAGTTSVGGVKLAPTGT
jgi:hypothetical protein